MRLRHRNTGCLAGVEEGAMPLPCLLPHERTTQLHRPEPALLVCCVSGTRCELEAVCMRSGCEQMDVVLLGIVLVRAAAAWQVGWSKHVLGGAWMSASGAPVSYPSSELGAKN